MIRGKYLYEIDCPQVSPFLPEKIDDLQLINEEECLDYLLSQGYF